MDDTIRRKEQAEYEEQMERLHEPPTEDGPRAEHIGDAFVMWEDAEEVWLSAKELPERLQNRR